MSNITLSAFALLFYFSCCTQLAIGQIIPRELSHSIGNPSSLVTMDIDQDGLIDIVSSAKSDNAIVWYKNQGDTVFEKPKTIAKYAMNIEMIAKADLNNDGNDDIISANSGDGSLMWYKNEGNANFSTGISITNSFPYASLVSIADINNDGWLDVVAGSLINDRLSWFPNLNGVFGDEHIISTVPDGPTTLVCADFDNDGFIDIACGTIYDTQVNWFKNLGTGLFSAPELIFDDNSTISSLEVFDANIDGNIDLFIASADKVRMCMNQGGGSFITTIISTPDNPVSLSFIDFDNDQLKDLILLSIDDSEVQWQKNLGSGAFSSILTLLNQVTFGSYILPFDFGNNGFVDLVIAAKNAEITIKFHKSDEAGGFIPPYIISPEIYFPNDINVSDINGDTYPDILFCTSKSSIIGCFKNDGYASFDSLEVLFEFPYSTMFKNLRTADIDNDGDLDIIALSNNLSNDSIFWIKNDGTGIFHDPKKVHSFNFTNQPTSFECSDIDSDGDVDILACASSNDKITWFENDGTGNFAPFQIITTSVDVPFIDFFEVIDGDIDLDIVSASLVDKKIAWYENLGIGVFGVQQIITTTTSTDPVRQLYVIDIDNDGLVDILKGCMSSDEISWYKNLGGGNFSLKQIISMEIDNNVICPIDFDSDGDIDIMVSEDEFVFTVPRILWLENTGGGIFETNGQTLQSGRGEALSNFLYAADVDLDGDFDIINNGGTRENASIWLLENKWGNLTKVSGKVYIDVNLNSIYDNADVEANFIPVISSPLADFGYTNISGNYSIDFRDTSQVYQLSPQLSSYWEIVSDSLFYTIIVDSIYTYRDSLFFGIYPTAIIDSISTEITGGFPRCNDTINYWLNVKNTGTTILEGMISMDLYDSIQFVSSVPPPDSIVGSMIYWNYKDLFYLSDTLINLSVALPDFNSSGDNLTSILSASIFDSGGLPIFTSTDTLEQILACAYDPNDKISEESGIGVPGYIDVNTESLDYTIRFQNTGNDTAIVVVIKDQLDAAIDKNSFQKLASSHNVTIFMDQTGKITFTFPDIMLPDSTTDVLGSQGFVKYRVNLLPGLPQGTVIRNSAEIYFDINPPIITNTKLNTLFTCSDVVTNLNDISICSGDSVLIFNQYRFSSDIYYDSLYAFGGCDSTVMQELLVKINPIVSLNEFSQDTICNYSNGIPLPSGYPIGGVYLGNGVSTGLFDPSIPPVGISYIKYLYVSQDGCEGIDSVSIVIDGCLSLNELLTSRVKVYPNPSSGSTTVYFGALLNGEYLIKFYDFAGELIMSTPRLFGTSYNLYNSSLSPGTYVLSLVDISTDLPIYSTRIVIN